jgi:Holliday junction resolvase
MPNKNYVKGRKKEYKIIKELKAQGYEIAQRTAGSHSPIDVFAIKKDEKKILLIQAKAYENMNNPEFERIEKELSWLTGPFEVVFILK